MAGAMRLQYNAMIRIIPLRCLGLHEFGLGWRRPSLRVSMGVLLMGCKKGDEYQWPLRARKRAGRVPHGKTCVKSSSNSYSRKSASKCTSSSISDYRKIPKIMDDFLEVIDTTGLNPYKGHVDHARESWLHQDSDPSLRPLPLSTCCVRRSSPPRPVDVSQAALTCDQSGGHERIHVDVNLFHTGHLSDGVSNHVRFAGAPRSSRGDIDDALVGGHDDPGMTVDEVRP